MLANNRRVLSTGSDKYSGYTCLGKRKREKEGEIEMERMRMCVTERKYRLAPTRSRRAKRNSIDFNEITLLLFYY